MAPRLVTLLLLVALGGQNPAAAQQAQGPRKMFGRMDADGDGRITESEWTGPPKAFVRIDRNGDGFVTRGEFGARAGQGRRTGPTPQGPSAAPSATTPWIDTHVHLRLGSGSLRGGLEQAQRLMNEAGIRWAVVLPQPFPKQGRSRNRYDIPQLSELTKAFPGRFVLLGGGHLINGLIEGTPPEDVTEAVRRSFAEKATAILDAGAKGFGEMGMMHLSHFPGHPSYWVRPDHPLFLLLADIAGARQAVIDIHMDVVERDAPTPRPLAKGQNPAAMKANVDLFERFVAHNRDARIVLAHAGWDVTGQWSAALSRRLLAAHSNLYMSLKITGLATRGKNRMMTAGNPPSVNAEWLSVFEDFPDRFVIGSDSFFAEQGARGRAPGGMTQFRGQQNVAFLKALPPALAQRIAVDNAVALYGTP